MIKITKNKIKLLLIFEDEFSGDEFVKDINKIVKNYDGKIVEHYDKTKIVIEVYNDREKNETNEEFLNSWFLIIDSNFCPHCGIKNEPRLHDVQFIFGGV